MWCASPLSILISINSRALSSASRCLLSSLTTPPLSLGQPPLFMILSNPWHRHLLVDRRYTLRRTRAATSRHTPAPRRAEGERLMGFLDRLFGRKEEPREQPLPPTSHGPSDEGHQPADADEQALQRYRYMLKTRRPRRSSRPTKRRLRSLRQASEQRRCVSWLRRHRRVKGRRWLGGVKTLRAWRGWRHG